MWTSYNVTLLGSIVLGVNLATHNLIYIPTYYHLPTKKSKACIYLVQCISLIADLHLSFCYPIIITIFLDFHVNVEHVFVILRFQQTELQQFQRVQVHLPSYKQHMGKESPNMPPMLPTCRVWWCQMERLNRMTTMWSNHSLMCIVCVCVCVCFLTTWSF